MVNFNLSQPGEHHLFLEGNVGKIEAKLIVPEQMLTDVIMVICHPHPLGGGTMDNKVVTTMARACTNQGIASLRFNFRGVGQSEGLFDNAKGEVNDLLAILAVIKQELSEHSILLAGFSFGAYIAYQGCIQSACDLLVSIAPAIHLYDFTELALPQCPWMIIQGENDELVPVQQLYDWVEAIQPAAELIRLPETSHFFHGQLIALRKTCESILQKMI